MTLLIDVKWFAEIDAKLKFEECHSVKGSIGLEFVTGAVLVRSVCDIANNEQIACYCNEWYW